MTGFEIAECIRNASRSKNSHALSGAKDLYWFVLNEILQMRRGAQHDRFDFFTPSAPRPYFLVACPHVQARSLSGPSSENNVGGKRFECGPPRRVAPFASRSADLALTPHRGLSTMGGQQEADPSMRDRRYRAAAPHLAGCTPKGLKEGFENVPP
jgi:hypothetical protein